MFHDTWDELLVLDACIVEDLEFTITIIIRKASGLSSDAKCFDSPALDHQLIDNFWTSRGRRKPISIENLVYGLKLSHHDKYAIVLNRAVHVGICFTSVLDIPLNGFHPRLQIS